ncbi:two-component regulator propeller domain-containing protein [Motilimonas sp. KMU-193]|uniref:two-component regulator propeller domain-containing protein n=1 Tax=Motilimonas sp. KMU-193 TaxID=3388668 RepID=UPI00396B220B
MMKVFALFYICFLCWVKAATALPFQGAHLIDAIGLEQGLSQATVVSVVQDQQGYLWIGTQDGLNRYDGKQIQQYRYSVNDDNSLSGNYISGLVLDSQQRLWVLTPQGLNLYQSQTDDFKRFAVTAQVHQRNIQSPWSITATADGALWLKSAHGISRFDTLNYSEQAIVLAHSSDLIVDFAVTADAQVWLLYEQALALKQAGADSQMIALDLQPKDKLIAIAAEQVSTSHTIVWLLSVQGIYRYDVASNTSLFYDKEALGITPRLTQLAIDSKGMLWLGTRQGLYKWSPAMLAAQYVHHQIGESKGLKDAYIRQLYFDRSGVLWIGTRLGGLSRLTPQAAKFQLYNQYQGMMDNDVVMSLKYANNALWLGLADGAISRIDPVAKSVQKWRPSSASGQHLGVIVDIEQDVQGNIWFASNRGLAKYISAEQRFEFVAVKVANGEAATYISQLFVFDHRLWLASSEFGLAYYDPAAERFHFIEDSAEPALASVSSVLVNGQETWLGTFDGQLFRLAGNGARGYEYQPQPLNFLGQPLKLDIIGHIFLAPNGALWLSNRNGLVAYQPGQGEVKILSAQRDYPSGAYYEAVSIGEHIWVSQAHSLLKVTPHGEVVAVYSQAHGLPVHEFNGASEKLDSLLLLGSVNGLLAVDTTELKQDEISLPVMLSDIKTQMMHERGLSTKQWHSVAQPEGALGLDYDNATVKIAFSDLDFGHAPTYFRYRLTGFDQHWNLAEPAHNEAIYHHLPPGQYVFEVESSKSLDNWNGSRGQLAITVATPFWQTSWAWLIYILAFALLVFGYTQLRLKMANNQAKQLRGQVKLRTKTIEQLLLQRVNAFARIANDLKNPLSLIQAPVALLKQQASEKQTLEQLQLIETQTAKVMLQLDRLVHLSQASEGHFAMSEGHYELSQLVHQVAEQVCGSADMSRDNIVIQWRGVSQVEGNLVQLEGVIFQLLSYMITKAKAHSRINVYGRVWGSEVKLWCYTQSVHISSDQSGAIGLSISEMSATNALQLDELGLAILHQAVRQLGAKIRITQHVSGEFSLIELSFAHRPTAQTEHREQAIRGDLPTWLKQHKQVGNSLPKLLLASADVSMAQFLQRLFVDDYQVITLDKPSQLVKLANKTMPSAILIDFEQALPLCEELKQGCAMSIPVLVLLTQTDPKLRLALLNAGVSHVLNKPFELAELKAIVVNTVANMATKVSQYQTAEPSPDSDDDFIKQIDMLIASHYGDPEFSVQTLSELSGISMKQLQRKLKTIANVTPNEYLRNYRLTKAKQLLSEPLTIQEIALRCGFNSPSYFTSCYKKEFNQTPKQAQAQGVEAE